MHRLIRALTFFALAACSVAPQASAPLRQPGSAIYSIAGLDAARLEGSWQQVATFAPGGQVHCGPGGAVFTQDRIDWALCLAAGPSRGSGAPGAGLPGRFALPGMADWWVLWVDAENRTALIGTPDGAFGFVLNRDGTLAPDRLQAVRDIAVFNGYRAEDLVLF